MNNCIVPHVSEIVREKTKGYYGLQSVINHSGEMSSLPKKGSRHIRQEKSETLQRFCWQKIVANWCKLVINCHKLINAKINFLADSCDTTTVGDISSKHSPRVPHKDIKDILLRPLRTCKRLAVTIHGSVDHSSGNRTIQTRWETKQWTGWAWK